MSLTSIFSAVSLVSRVDCSEEAAGRPPIGQNSNSLLQFGWRKARHCFLRAKNQVAEAHIYIWIIGFY